MKLVLLLIQISITFVAARYEIYMDRIEDNLENDGTSVLWDFSHLRVKKFNRTASVYSGYFQTFKTIGNDYHVEVEASNLQGGQYKVMLVKNFGPFCDLIWQETVRDEINRYRQHMNLTIEDNQCPFPPLITTLQDYTPKDFGEYLPEYIPGNERWKMKVMFMKNKKIAGSYDVYIILRSKESMFTNISSGKK